MSACDNMMCRVEYAIAMLYTCIPEAWCVSIVCALFFKVIKMQMLFTKNCFFHVKHPIFQSQKVDFFISLVKLTN